MNTVIETSGGTSRRELMMFFYKFRMRLALAFLIPFTLTLVISTLPTPRYAAESVLVVRLGSEYVYQPEVGNSQSGANVNIPFDSEQIFKSEVAILASHDLHKEVIQKLGIARLYPEIIDPTPFSRVKAFIMGGFLTALTNAKEPTSEDLEQIRLTRAVEVFGKRLDIFLEQESAVIRVSYEHRNREVAKEALETLLNFYFEKRKQLYLDLRTDPAESQMNEAQRRVNEAQKQLENFKLEHKLYSLTDQRKQLLDKRNDAERRAMSINSASLKKEIEGYNESLNTLDKQERVFTGLQKEIELANEAYALTAHRYEEAKAYERLQQDRASSVRIIQPPTAPAEPKKLKNLIILAGAVLSLLFTLIIAGISEFSRRGFMTPEEAERQLGLPVLAVVPYFSSR